MVCGQKVYLFLRCIKYIITCICADEAKCSASQVMTWPKTISFTFPLRTERRAPLKQSPADCMKAGYYPPLQALPLLPPPAPPHGEVLLVRFSRSCVPSRRQLGQSVGCKHCPLLRRCNTRQCTLVRATWEAESNDDIFILSKCRRAHPG